MVQRIFEMASGLCASVLGFLILFSAPSGTFSNASSGQRYGFSGQPAPPLAWLPMLLLFVAVLAVIGLASLLHGVFGIIHISCRASATITWVGRLTLWLSTAGLIVLVYLAAFSSGLLLIPSVALAVIACALSLIPGSASGPHA